VRHEPVEYGSDDAPRAPCPCRAPHLDLLGGGSGLPAQAGLRESEAAVRGAAAPGDVTVTAIADNDFKYPIQP
jgi:hypothetical protein